MLNIKGTYHIVANFFNTLDMKITYSRNIFSVKPTYEQFNNDKSVTTDQILDLSSGQVTNNAYVPNQTSYQYKRFIASGIIDIVQINITDNTLSNIDFQI